MFLQWYLYDVSGRTCRSPSGTFASCASLFKLDNRFGFQYTCILDHALLPLFLKSIFSSYQDQEVRHASCELANWWDHACCSHHSREANFQFPFDYTYRQPSRLAHLIYDSGEQPASARQGGAFDT